MTGICTLITEQFESSLTETIFTVIANERCIRLELKDVYQITQLYTRFIREYEDEYEKDCMSLKAEKRKGCREAN